MNTMKKIRQLRNEFMVYFSVFFIFGIFSFIPSSFSKIKDHSYEGLNENEVRNEVRQEAIVRNNSQGPFSLRYTKNIEKIDFDLYFDTGHLRVAVSLSEKELIEYMQISGVKVYFENSESALKFGAISLEEHPLLLEVWESYKKSTIFNNNNLYIKKGSQLFENQFAFEDGLIFGELSTHNDLLRGYTNYLIESYMDRSTYSLMYNLKELENSFQRIQEIVRRIDSLKNKIDQMTSIINPLNLIRVLGFGESTYSYRTQLDDEFMKLSDYFYKFSKMYLEVYVNPRLSDVLIELVLLNNQRKDHSFFERAGSLDEIEENFKKKVNLTFFEMRSLKFMIDEFYKLSLYSNTRHRETRFLEIQEDHNELIDKFNSFLSTRNSEISKMRDIR